MKIYYFLAVLIQLFLAFLIGNRNKVSYMFYLLRSLFDIEINEEKNDTNSFSLLKLKNETINDDYSFLLER